MVMSEDSVIISEARVWHFCQSTRIGYAWSTGTARIRLDTYPSLFFFNFFFLSNWVRQGYGFGAAWYAANPNYTVKKDATASCDSFTMKKEGGATTAHR